ncbi:hypothetical protein ID866_7633 [Astraeus odoratus]|nr:hypothetical protein ID866_7633 [Astraeus odoratus]
MSSLTFWKPGTVAPGSSLDRATQEEGTVIQSAPASGSLSIQAQRQNLPIAKHRPIRRKRPALRLIISSATLDARAFHEYFCANTSADEATIVSLEGRAYPVEVAYLNEPAADYVNSAVELVWSINQQLLQHGSGDILVFLTGREDIERFLEDLLEHMSTQRRGTTEIIPLPLHSGLTTEEQLRVFQPAERNTRKVIAATNIAEASVTIDGVKFVVDCGFVKVDQIRTYNPTSLLSSLSTVPVSLASATQRAGRAGRTSPGICYRLFPESTLASLLPSTPPEITRTDMSTPILQLKSLGIDDLMKFEWVTAPPAESVLRALEGLVAAGMVGEDGRLTVLGQQAAEWPVEISLARMLFSSKDFKCGEEILTIAAMTSIQDAFVIPEGAQGALAELERRKFTAEEGDHLTLLNAYNAFTKYGKSSSWCKTHALNFRAMSRAVSIRSQLKKYMVLHVHPNSVLFTRKPRSGWVVFHEMEETKKNQCGSSLSLFHLHET